MNTNQRKTVERLLTKLAEVKQNPTPEDYDTVRKVIEKSDSCYRIDKARGHNEAAKVHAEINRKAHDAAEVIERTYPHVMD